MPKLLQDNPKAALIIIDMQNDFLQGGALEVPQANEIITDINKLSHKAKNVICTQDWHPEDHISFAQNHKDKKAYETIDTENGPQKLWPAHCVQGSFGAKIHKDIEKKDIKLIIRKGYRKELDSYSAFFENDHKTPTGLNGYLKEKGIDTLFFCGVATDFCVAYSALDAVKCGFTAHVILNACRAIDTENSLDTMLKKMQEKGVKLLLGA